MRPRLVSVAVMLALLGSLSGCATSRMDLMRSHFGFRPDEPAITAIKTVGQTVAQATADQACTEYAEYVTYAQQLQEAYHTRATHNRGWIYFAGLLGLGAAAASGGLAAASAATVGTLALLSISGGFSAAAFATIDNSELASMYTTAANSVDSALKDSETKRLKDPTLKNSAACAAALQTLKAGVSDARTNLETRRTTNAVGALARAVEQRNQLDKVIQDAQPTPKVEPAEVVLAAGAKTEVLVLGAAATTAAVSPANVVTATLKDGGHKVELEGKVAGDVIVTVATAAGKTAKITVTVK